MIPLESGMTFPFVDDDGTQYEFRYLTGKCRPQYVDLVNQWTTAQRRLKKLSSLTEDEVQEGEIFSLQEKFQALNESLINMFLVSINGIKFEDPVQGFFQEQPSGYINRAVELIFDVMPYLQGQKIDESKNSSRRHSSVLNQKTGITGANNAAETGVNESDA